MVYYCVHGATILTGERFKVSFDIQPPPPPTYTQGSAFTFSSSSCLCWSETCPGSGSTFSALCLLWIHNSCVTRSRTRDVVPWVLSQHLFLTPYAVYLPDKVSNKVGILSEYLHILMENSPATFQTLYLWLNINIPNRHIFHRKVWNITRSSHVVYSCDFLKPVPDWEANWKYEGH